MKAERIKYFERRGYQEGQLDTLFKSELTTVKDRAMNAFLKLGHSQYFKEFLKGYERGANAEQ